MSPLRTDSGPATEALSVTSLPLRGLAVEVVEGPDKGTRVTARSERISIGTAAGNDLRLTDSTVSRFHADLVRRDERIQVIDHDSTNGTGLAGALLEGEGVFVRAGTVLGVGRSRVRVDDAGTVKVETHAGGPLAGIVGASSAIRRVMAQVARVAGSDSPVLILGESGTGKERIAAAIHELGPRASGPFVTVDCGSLAPTLVSSELFGHEKGAFTGAEKRRAGAFEQANGGDLFLDEIGELAPEMQSTLLGVLERGRFRRVGGEEDIQVDVRVIAATHRDLRAEINQGRFRLDLYYRLAVVILRIPSLRERPEDVPLLAEHFLREAGWNGPVDEILPASTMSELQRHAWPGNVRELRNLVEATVAMGEPPPFTPATASAGAGVGAGTASEPPPDVAAALGTYREAQRAVLDSFERRFLGDLLTRCEGNVSRAAREAKMNRSHLIDLLQRHGLK